MTLRAPAITPAMVDALAKGIEGTLGGLSRARRSEASMVTLSFLRAVSQWRKLSGRAAKNKRRGFGISAEGAVTGTRP